MSATKTATLYDLMLLLEPERDQQDRDQLVTTCKRLIEQHGQLVRHEPWGVRELAYPIKHRRHAEYHLLQFHPAGAELLNELDRLLRISDPVLRYRIVKLAPGTPPPPQRHHEPAPPQASEQAPAPEAQASERAAEAAESQPAEEQVPPQVEEAEPVEPQADPQGDGRPQEGLQGEGELAG